MHSQGSETSAAERRGHWRRSDLLRFLGNLRGPIERQGSRLLDVPQQELIELLEESEDELWQVSERSLIYRLLVVDLRKEVRRAVVQAIGVNLERVSPEYVEELLFVLACDVSKKVRAAVPAVFAAWLDVLDAPDQAALIERWATSQVADVRVVAARALARHVSLWCSEYVLSLLVNDGDDAVRRAAAIAAGSRLAEAPDFYGAICERVV